MSAWMNTELPLVAAPMAGGATTDELAAAATSAGAFAILAGGYLSAAALDERIRAARVWGDFGVNLFVPGTDTVDGTAFARYADALEGEARAAGVELDPVPRTDDDAWHEKLALLCAQPVPVVSLTFGLPDRSDIGRLQRAGTAVLATVTTSTEARAAVEAGVDGLVVQGPSAGGHSATWDPNRRITDGQTAPLVSAVRAITALPLIAAGGVDGPASVTELLRAGADSVAVGTLLLRTDESGASATHRAALASPAYTDTTMTRTFTGRPARALRNGFIARHEAHEITAYPAVHHLTRELRRRAAEAGDADRVHLWAGTGYRAAQTGPAAHVIRALAAAL
ncbi:nitronate monooxygenase [Leucobacter tardus]|nr:nitronate monooxygenase [Leucobacter tardus]